MLKVFNCQPKGAGFDPPSTPVGKLEMPTPFLLLNDVYLNSLHIQCGHLLTCRCVCVWQGNKRGKKGSECDLWRAQHWLCPLGKIHEEDAADVYFSYLFWEKKKCFPHPSGLLILFLSSADYACHSKHFNRDISWPHSPPIGINSCFFLFKLFFFKQCSVC